ncbi:hypothetical protein [Pseudomonas sp. 24 R 17]|nr:hypothetical protein [Pseudomonas sp. 35 E 8]CRM47428.1 hypothetical protein [Pseudomonas sp. 24 R 17]
MRNLYINIGGTCVNNNESGYLCPPMLAPRGYRSNAWLEICIGFWSTGCQNR